MRPLLDELAARIDELRKAGLHRSLSLPQGIDFSSNDYLGLSRHPRILDALRASLERGPAGAPASRLLRGNLPEHLAIEERLARWKGTEAALLFPSGYQANLALLSALIGPGDVAVSDASNHASIIDGLRLARCEKAIYRHLDLEQAERALRERPRGGRAFVVTESLFSMDGDAAQLDVLARIAERHGAALIVDDAHGAGVYGHERGSGLCEQFGVERRAAAIVTTCGKALGLAGAFVAGPRVLIEYLVNRARPFIFSTAAFPPLAAAIGAALDVIADEPWRRERVLGLAARLRGALRAGGIDCSAGEGPIVPVVLGENERAMRIAEAVRARGFDVRAIRPPSVPAGTARIRLSVHADHAESEVDGIARALIEAAAA